MPSGSGTALVMVENDKVSAEPVAPTCAHAQTLTIVEPRRREREKALTLGTGICFSEKVPFLQERCTTPWLQAQSKEAKPRRRD
jgi:hypothetical protein